MLDDGHILEYPNHQAKVLFLQSITEFDEIYEVELTKDGDDAPPKRLFLIVPTKESIQEQESVEDYNQVVQLLQGKDTVWRNLNFDRVVEVNGIPCLLLEKFSKGVTLEEFIGFHKENKENINQWRLFTFLNDLSNIISEMNMRGVICRDLSPHSLFVDGKLKVTYLGINSCRPLRTRLDLEETHKVSGVDLYMAPEVIKLGLRGQCSVVWSLGIILHRILSLEDSPFEGKNYHQRLWNQVRGKYKPLPDSVFPFLKDLVARMLEPNHLKRILFKEIVEAIKLGFTTQAATVDVTKEKNKKYPNIVDIAIEKVITNDSFGEIMMVAKSCNTGCNAYWIVNSDIQSTEFDVDNLKIVGSTELKKLEKNGAYLCGQCGKVKMVSQAGPRSLENIFSCRCNHLVSAWELYIQLDGFARMQGVAFPELLVASNQSLVPYVTASGKKTRVAVHQLYNIERKIDSPRFLNFKYGHRVITGLLVLMGEVGCLYNDGSFVFPGSSELRKIKYEEIRKWTASSMVDIDKVAVIGHKRDVRKQALLLVDCYGSLLSSLILDTSITNKKRAFVKKLDFYEYAGLQSSYKYLLLVAHCFVSIVQVIKDQLIFVKTIKLGHSRLSLINMPPLLGDRAEFKSEVVQSQHSELVAASRNSLYLLRLIFDS